MLLEALPTPFPYLFQGERWRNNFVWWKAIQESYKLPITCVFLPVPKLFSLDLSTWCPGSSIGTALGSSARCPSKHGCSCYNAMAKDISTQGPELIRILEHWGNNWKLSGLGKRTGKGSENVEQQELSVSILKRSCLSAGTTDLLDRNHPHPP